MHKPLVSIIIPVYNVEKYIERCILSILNQTLQNIEIVVVNDCTQDSSMEIVRRYADKDTRIKIFEYEQNSGPMWARMIGCKNASGEYFTFCDSDDYLPLNAVKTLYDAVNLTNADIIVGSNEWFPIQGSSIVNNYSLNYGDTTFGILKSLLKGECSHSLCGKIYKRKLFDDYQYDVFKNFTNAEDAIMFYEIIENVSKVGVINNVVYNYMQNMGSSSNKRLSNAQVVNYVTWLNIRQNIISKYHILNDELESSNCKEIMTLLLQNYNKSIVLNTLQSIDINKLFKFTSLRVKFSYFKAFLYVVIWNFKILRWGYYNINLNNYF